MINCIQDLNIKMKHYSKKLLTCPLFLAASKLSFIRGERGDRGDRGENERLYEGSKS